METTHPTNKRRNMNYQRGYSGVQLYVEENGMKKNNGIFQRQN